MFYGDRRERSVNKNILQQQALKRGGAVGSYHSAISMPYFSFTYCSIDVIFSSVRGSPTARGVGSPGYNYLQASLKKLEPYDVYVVRENFLTRFRESIGFPDFKIGNEEFDRKFLIKAKREIYAQKVLTLGVQQIFLRLLEYNFEFEINAGVVTLRFYSPVEKASVLDLWMDSFLLILDKIKTGV